MDMVSVLLAFSEGITFHRWSPLKKTSNTGRFHGVDLNKLLNSLVGGYMTRHDAHGASL